MKLTALGNYLLIIPCVSDREPRSLVAVFSKAGRWESSVICRDAKEAATEKRRIIRLHAKIAERRHNAKLKRWANEVRRKQG